MAINTLTTNDIEQAFRDAKTEKKNKYPGDGGRMFLLVRPDGEAFWRLKYKFNGVEKLMSLGDFRTVSLKLARKRRDDARKQVEEGADPGHKKKEASKAEANTLRAISNEYFASVKPRLAPSTYNRDFGRMGTHVLSDLGSRPIQSIKPGDVLAVLRKLEKDKRYGTIAKVRGICGRVWDYAVVTDRAPHNFIASLRGATARVKPEHRPAITDPVRLGDLLRAIHGYSGQPAVMAAFRLAPLVFARPGELRTAEWKEIDLDAATCQWRSNFPHFGRSKIPQVMR